MQAEALEHYLNKQSKEKHFYTLKNGGHNLLSLSLNEFFESSKSLKQNWKKE
jgi:hypothetical protein